jgi:alpha-glucosidase
VTSLASPPLFSLAGADSNHLVLHSPEGHVAHVFVLEEDILRVMVLPEGKLRAPRGWSVSPGEEDIPASGRDRFDLAGFALPNYVLDQGPGKLVLTTQQLRLTVTLAGLHCRWENRIDGEWRAAAADRATQSYNFGWWDQRVYHYLERGPDEKYFGLGERAGTSDRAGQRYRMTNLDAMGYNARTTDPLYKHIPFYLTWKTAARVPLGIFYDNLSDSVFDMGRELDNYHGPYRSYVAEYGDLDYYVIGGATPDRITRRYTWLTGRPAFTPKWSLGYSGSTMSYTDAPDAQARMNEFLAKCAEHDILCESFHLSSGYTSIGDKRYVFHWNRDKFPDPKAFAANYLAHGIRLCPNIKPCLLGSHPRFAEAARAGLFIHNTDGTPLMVQFWGEAGAYLDFTNPQTLTWWKAQVTDSLLDYGLMSTWNDNNEFEIWNDTARIAGFGTPAPAVTAKPLQTMLMMQASQQAQRAFDPNRRPFLVSRSGAAGMQRYVQSWSGDNFTSWETLKFNIRMGTGLAMSGVSNTGHDIGGFAGPPPEPELWLRWVQFGIFLPRFSIHSWRDDGSSNEPWMYPQIAPTISALIKFRARLVPYLYDLLWKYHRFFEPVIRPTFYEFPDDPRCFEENDDMLLGPNLLVAAVVEPGVQQRRVYLPAGAGWYDYWSGGYYAGGQTTDLPAPFERPPLLARAGSAIALNLAEQHFNRPADERGFAVFPDRSGRGFVADCFEDDGESESYRAGQYGLWHLRVDEATTHLTIGIAKHGARPPQTEALTILLPRQESRQVTAIGATIVSDRLEDAWRIVRLRCA